MTKIALYAIIRVLFDLVGPVGWWVGVVLLVLGAARAVMGVLYGLFQRDLKTLLAYSTVENIGIIAIGLGLAQLFRANGLGVLASLAMTAALFHCVSHAMLKSLLFCGAGAVLNATGLRDIERLGALIHRMPVTAVAVLIGAAGLSALPPLNGFVSEWLTFQAVLAGAHLPQWALKFGIAVIGALLALTAALAAALFVRAYGIVFLGRPRSSAAAEAVEASPSMANGRCAIRLPKPRLPSRARRPTTPSWRPKTPARPTPRASTRFRSARCMFGLRLSEADLGAALATVESRGTRGPPHPFFA